MENPLASVIVPVYNDPQGIEATLQSLCRQTYGNYEVLAVDNGSTDNTGDKIQEMAELYPDLVNPIDEYDVQGSYAARNTGIAYSTGEILVFIDANMTVEEDWLTNIVERIMSTDCSYLGYNVVLTTTEKPTIWERYEQALAFPTADYLEQEDYVPTNALAVVSSLIDEVGNFDEELVSGGDKEFGHRVARAGLEQCYTDEIVAYHPARKSFSALRQKAFRVGRGLQQFRSRHPDYADIPHPLHPIRFLPPNPVRLNRQFRSNGTKQIDPIVFYIIEYILKLFQTVGALRQRLHELLY